MILAYGEGLLDPYDDQIPPGLRNWLERAATAVAGRDERSFSDASTDMESAKQTKSNAPRGSSQSCSFDGEVVDRIGPLLQTKWGQGCGYNDFVTKAGNSCGHAPTGCVATAAAQVMRYHRYPTDRNWDAMSDTSGSPESARLMSDIGIAVKMKYEKNSSGAWVEDLQKALVKNFHYAKSPQLVSFSQSVVAQEIQAGRPVIAVGYADKNDCGFLGLSTCYSKGHAWVYDGIEIRCVSVFGRAIPAQFQHVNWGWNGSQNGYYYDLGEEFPYQQQILIKIKPS